MKKILTLLIAFTTICLLVGCGGGGGGSDEPSSDSVFKLADFSQTNETLSITLTTKQNINSPQVTNPKGYVITEKPNKTYLITGPAIINRTAEDIEKTFTISYYLNNDFKTTEITVPIPPTEDPDNTSILVDHPTAKYKDAVKLSYSYEDHLITVSISLPEALKNQGLKYIWHLNSKTGKKLNGTDSVYENSDFIYRPADTEIIPADVTTGKNRVYNRGFKQGYTYVGQYLYLTVETETGTTLGTRVFYVADPQTPPIPNK